MSRDDRTREYWIALFLLGVAVLTPPLLLVFNQPTLVFGIPVLFLYLFVAWSGLIALAAAIAHRSGHEVPDLHGDGSAQNLESTSLEEARDA